MVKLFARKPKTTPEPITSPNTDAFAANETPKSRATRAERGMRTYVLGALALVAVGLVASYFLIPNKKEVAIMQAKDIETIDTGNVDIEAEYKQGRRTYPIMSALAEKRVTEGDRPGAILILEEYVKANGTDVNGHKKLAEQYQLAGRQADYNTELEAIAAAEPTEANLHVLSDVYNANKDYVRQAQTLQKIVEVTNGEKPQSFVDLATIQVVVDDKEGALKTVEALKAKHPEFVSYSMTRIQVSVLAGKGEVDKAFQIAQDWVNAQHQNNPSAPPSTPQDAAIAPTPAQSSPEAKELADLCNILHYSGHADKAVALVEPHLDMLTREPELVVAYVNANITAGRSDHAYAILQKIDQAGTMTAQLYPPYLELAIKREDIPAAETIANKLDTAAFNEEQALNIIELARANNATSVLNTLTTRFGETKSLEGKPVLGAVISILKNAKDTDKRIETALNTKLSSTQRIRLAESCARAKKTACFDAIVKQFPPMDQMSPAQIAEYAQLYIIADRASELVDPVGQKAALPNAHADVQTAHRRLAAASGRLDVLKPWLEANANTAPIGHMQELFYLSNDRHHGDVASDIAQRLYARDPSPMNRDILISAYIGADQNEKAVELLREQIKISGANDGLYISTLTKLARKSTSYRKELTDYAQASLQSGRGDARQQLNYAYVLINNGAKDKALPFAKQFANQRGGEWKKMVAQLTQKPGQGGAPAVKLTREQMVAMASSKTISEANKRQLAFQLLNAGYKPEATAIFTELAASKGPESQEVKDLLFMWGGKLNAEQLAWLKARAANANAYDRSRWSDIITAHADDKALLQYVSSTPDALYNPTLRKNYFRVVAESGNRSNYEQAMRGWVAQTTDVAALIDYASVGQAHGYREAASNGYKRVLELDPNNETALNKVAAMDFSKGKYTEADQKLNRYLSIQQQRPDRAPDAAQAHFYKAELLRRQGNKPAAMQEYNQVVQLTPASAQTPADALSRLFTSQFHLGQHAAAKAGFNQLLADHPDDKGILADYMSVLIEYKYINEATNIANHYDKSSPYYGKGAALTGKSAHVASIERLSDGREMKITFDAPLEEKSPINAKSAAKAQWLAASEQGYDSVTISAKPGYVVRYVPTSQQQFAVVPAQAAPQYDPQAETKRQQDLRLQLLYARIEQESGQTERAKQRLAALAQYYPNEPQLITTQAGVEAAAGNNDRAWELIQQAQALAPENEDYASMMRASRTVDSKQFVKLDHEYRNYGSTDEQITTISAVTKVTHSAELGMNLMNDSINPKSITDPKSGLVTAKDKDRQSREFFLGYYLDSGDRAQLSLFANNDTVGAGAYFAHGSRIGRSELLAEYHKPYWDFPEAVYADATRDRVGFRHYATLSKHNSIGLEGSLNNYNVAVDENNTQSGLFRLSLAHELRAKTATTSYLGVNYGFDGEYLFDKPNSRIVNGRTYRPFPLTDREVHQFTGVYSDDWTPRTHALFDAGWVFDRLGENGPVVEGRINQDITDQVEAGVRGRYSRVNSNTDGDAVNLGADLMYKF